MVDVEDDLRKQEVAKRRKIQGVYEEGYHCGRLSQMLVTSIDHGLSGNLPRQPDIWGIFNPNSQVII
jgi:hypothetical protein